jgi:DNA-binding response OmpR family regulator
VLARVLVVEDDAVVRDVVGRYLTEAGYRVELAEDGTAGLEAAARWEPDLVVLDLLLPWAGDP